MYFSSDPFLLQVQQLRVYLKLHFVNGSNYEPLIMKPLNSLVTSFERPQFIFFTFMSTLRCSTPIQKRDRERDGGVIVHIKGL